jgi:predicted acetyltransferase
MAEADVEAAAAMQVEAFGGALADAVGRYHEGARYTWRDSWVYELDGEVRAAAINIPATWWFRGCNYAVGAVAGVAVRPVDRRRGFASELMHAILRADRDAGRAYSLLYPFQHGFYRRLGYGSAGLMHFWRLPLPHMTDEPALRRNVRLLREADKPHLMELFARWLRESPQGGLERSPVHWKRRLEGEYRWVVYDGPKGITGYIAYGTSSNALEIRELVAVESEAERGLWSFVAAQIEQHASVGYHSPAGRPLWATLREPYMFEGPQHGFIINDVAGVTMSFMARGVDWPVALSSRAFPESVRGGLRLALTDSVFGDQRVGLKLSDGRATVSDFSSEADVRCDTSVFSQLCCGALSASSARWYGLLEGSDAAVRMLDAAFPEGPPFITQFDWF